MRPFGAQTAVIWLAVACCAMSVVPGGCSKKGNSEPFTVDRLIKKGFGADSDTPTEMAGKIFDEKDPDTRRMGIEMLSKKKWALRDPYLKRFAQLTDPKFEADPTVRAVAVRTLGRAGETKYQDQINAALDDPSPVVRCDAAIVLQQMPSEKTVTRLQLLAISSEESVDVRAAAVGALRHYRTDSVYKTLLRALDDEDFTVRSAAHKSLVFITGQDRGYAPENWAGTPDQLGQETLPEPVVRYHKRPWWDWMKVTKESEQVSPEAAEDEDNRSRWYDWIQLPTMGGGKKGGGKSAPDRPSWKPDDSSAP
jgi:hypothetical protein